MLINIAIILIILVFIGTSAYHTYLLKVDVLWYTKYTKEREYSDFLLEKKNEIEKKYNELIKEYEKFKNSADNKNS